MSDLGEISAEVHEALDRLDRVLARFADLDRNRLASLQARIADSPNQRQALAMVARARALLQQAGDGATAARRSGAGWLSQHGSAQSGRSGGEPIATAVKSHWDTGFATPGGRAYFAPKETSLRKLATALPGFPGEYTFDAHGDSEHVYIGDDALTAADVVELIEADSAWGHRPIRLFSCNAGRGDKPIAAEVADLAKVRVTAPDDYAWSGADGRVVVAPVKATTVDGVVVEVPDYDREGSWREFDPG